SDGIVAVRTALLRLFDRFELVHVPTERAKLPNPAAELPAAELAERVAGEYGLAIGDYWLEPVARAEYVLGWSDGDEWPVLRRIPLDLTPNNDAKRLGTKSSQPRSKACTRSTASACVSP